MMAVSYTQILSADMVVSEIEALLDWRNQILRHAFYAQTSMQQSADALPPSAMLMWCRREAERGTIDRKIEERFFLVHDELSKVARQVAAHDTTTGIMPLALYDAFENQVEAFITQLRRLQQDLADTAGAVDSVTGLRTVAGMKTDLRREQDRFDRKGTGFSVANLEVDKIADLQSKYDRRGQDVIYAGVAQVIAKTLRSFDDAYYLGKGEYLVVLKHVEFMDACAVMDRLRGEIELTPIFFADGQKAKVTVSCGISEALMRETPDIALSNAKAALQQAKAAGGNRVAEYREKSALEQYAKDMGRD